MLSLQEPPSGFRTGLSMRASAEVGRAGREALMPACTHTVGLPAGIAAGSAHDEDMVQGCPRAVTAAAASVSCPSAARTDMYRAEQSFILRALDPTKATLSTARVGSGSRGGKW